MARRRTRRSWGTGTLYKPRATADYWTRTIRADGSGKYVFMNLRTKDRQQAQALLDSDVVQAALRRLRQQ